MNLYPQKNKEAIVLTMMGCTHHCKNCNATDTWDFDQGVSWKKRQLLDALIKFQKENNMDKTLVITGGEPLSNRNGLFLKQFIDTCIKRRQWWNIYLETGYLDKDVPDFLWNYCTFIKTGRYDIKRLRAPRFKENYVQYGSTNQKLWYEGVLVSEKGKYYFNEAHDK